VSPPNPASPARLTTTRRLSPETADRLEAIRRAAIDVAATSGYDEFSMQEVAEVSGVSRTTLYKHFPSKDHLLFEALRDMWPTDLAKPSRGSSATKVKRYALDLFDFWIERPLLLEAMAKATVNVDYTAWRSATDEPTYRVLHQLLDDVAEEDREAVTLVLLHLFAGVVITWCQGLDTDTARSRLERGIAVVVGAT
jgi:AcrR family transcriptional regulator